jgi:hypothetical protein
MKQGAPSRYAAPGPNLEMAQAMMGKAGGAGIHGDRRTKRVRTRGAKKTRAIRDAM